MEAQEPHAKIPRLTATISSTSEGILNYVFNNSNVFLLDGITQTINFSDINVNNQSLLIALAKSHVDVEECINAARAYNTSKNYKYCAINSESLYRATEKCFNANSGISEPVLALLAHYVFGQITFGILENNQLVHRHQYVSEIFMKIFYHATGHLTTFKTEFLKKMIEPVKTMMSLSCTKSMPFIIWSRGIMYPNRTELYPKLSPGEFYFLKSENDNTKSIELCFANPEHAFLKHEMSSETLSLQITETFKNYSYAEAKLGSNKENETAQFIFSLKNQSKFVTENYSSSKPLKDLCKPILTFCSVNIPDEEIDKLETVFESNTGPLLYLREHRYGSVVVKFRNKFLVQKHPLDYNFFKLGTKTYWKEHSQILLAGLGSCLQYWLLDEEKNTGIEFKKIENISQFKWELNFCTETNHWTHPEIAFVGGVGINLDRDDCTISFEDHQCIKKFGCEDCRLCLGPVEVKKNYEDLDNPENKNLIQLDVSKYGSTSNTDTYGTTKITCSGKFARFKFAASCPRRQRDTLKQVSHIFEDFDKIEKIWKDECPDFYYSEWKKHKVK